MKRCTASLCSVKGIFLSLVFFCLMIALCLGVGTTLVVGLVGTQDLSTSLRTVTHSVAKSNLRSVLNDAESAANILATMLRTLNYDLTASNDSAKNDLYRIMYPLTLRFNVSGLLSVRRDGALHGLMHYPYGTRFYMRMMVNDTCYRRYELNYDPDIMTDHLTANESACYPPMDPSQGQYYRAALNHTQGVWTKIYLSPSRFVMTLAYTVPIVRNGEFLGTTAADYTLSRVGRVLNEHRYGKNGFVFVYDHTRCLVASTTGESITTTNAEKRIRADQALHPVTRAAAQFLFRRGALSEADQYSFVQSGNAYLLSVSQIELDRATRLNWTIALVIPRSDYFTQLDNMLYIMAGLSAALVIAGLVVTYLVVQRISKGLQRIIHEIDDVVHYREDAFTTTMLQSSRSVIGEVHQMQKSVVRMKHILQSFEKYIPVQLLRFLVRNDQAAKLGLSQSSATVLFADVANFTALMEMEDPELFIEQFTEYMDAMIDEIVAHHGTLDKMMGDGLMAFFGCPPNSIANHEYWACKCALACQSALARLRAKWIREGKPVFYIRIGMASGNVMVGNVGSSSRFQYTVLGDVVNLASRMEGLNKFFGTRILLTESTLAPAQRDNAPFITRLMGEVRVKGRQGTCMCSELCNCIDPWIRSELPPGAEKEHEMMTRAECGPADTTHTHTAPVPSATTTVEGIPLMHSELTTAALPHAVLTQRRYCDLFTDAVRHYRGGNFTEARRCLKDYMRMDWLGLKRRVEITQAQATHGHAHGVGVGSVGEEKFPSVRSPSTRPMTPIQMVSVESARLFPDASLDFAIRQLAHPDEAGVARDEYAALLLEYVETLCKIPSVPRHWSPVLVFTEK